MSVITPQSTPPHAALIWLVRGTGAVIAIPAALLALFAVLVMPIMMIMNSHRPASGGWMLLLGMALMLIGGLFYGAIAKFGYDMFRNVNTTTVANFAFIFSFLTAYSLYHALPLHLPEFLSSYIGKDAPFFSQGNDHGISYRATLSFLVFLIFYHVIKAYFLRVLGLNPPTFPPLDDDPTIPEFPQKSPLLPL